MRTRAADATGVDDLSTGNRNAVTGGAEFIEGDVADVARDILGGAGFGGRGCQRSGIGVADGDQLRAVKVTASSGVAVGDGARANDHHTHRITPNRCNLGIRV